MGKINFFIYYEVDGDTSKHCLQSSTYGRDKKESVGGCSSHPILVGYDYVGFLGSRSGHAAVSYFLGAKSMAVFLNGTVSEWPSLTVYREQGYSYRGQCIQREG